MRGRERDREKGREGSEFDRHCRQNGKLMRLKLTGVTEFV